MHAPSALLLALEGRAFIEWAACVAAWPLLSHAARGDGHPVLVLPGLTAGDASTWPLRKFIERCGYAVYPWELGLNCGPRDGVVRKLLARLREIERKHGRKVSLVGWSLGGAMARVLAVREPQRVRSVITLGSPLGGHPKATNAWRLFELVSGVRADDPRLRALMSRHPAVPSTSILSKTDGIVSWPMSLIPRHRAIGKHRSQRQPFRHGRQSGRAVGDCRPPGAAEGAWKPFDRERLARMHLRRSARADRASLSRPSAEFAWRESTCPNAACIWNTKATAAANILRDPDHGPGTATRLVAAGTDRCAGRCRLSRDRVRQSRYRPVEFRPVAALHAGAARDARASAAPEFHAAIPDRRHGRRHAGPGGCPAYRALRRGRHQPRRHGRADAGRARARTRAQPGLDDVQRRSAHRAVAKVRSCCGAFCRGRRKVSASMRSSIISSR